MTKISLTAPARVIRREIARIRKRLAATTDPEMHRLLWELGSLYVHVLYRRGLKP
jgi:hypothetical protein